MLESLTGNKKNIVNIAVIIVFIIVVIIVLKTFVFSGENDSQLTGTTEPTAFKMKSVKTLNLQLFEDEKFKALKDNRADADALKDVTVGKENPFIQK